MPGTAAKVRVSEKQLTVLQEVSRSRSVAKGIAQRALILVLGVQGLRNEQIDAQGTAGRGGQTQDRGEHFRRAGGPLLEAGGGLQPHRSKMWLNTTEKNPDTFERQAATVCQTDLETPRKAAVDGTHTVSVDEATSLQAIECNAPDIPVQPGSVAKQESEYTRHGTTTLTAGLDVVTGEIVSPTLEATRTEPEFVAHIARTVSVDPTREWIFIVDNLNTHASESLVEWVAQQCGVEDSLGKKTFVVSSHR